MENKKKYPWIICYNNLNQRCNNSNNPDYPRYGGRGIKSLISLEQIKFLWFFDKAYNMKNPSIDRFHNNDHYRLSNCRFIENEENSAKDKRKIILQFTKNNKFIKEWSSATEVNKILSISNSHIGQCVKCIRKTSGGYKWKYKEI